MFERRSVGRTAISKNASLFFDDEIGVLTCAVRDITNVGARLQLVSLNTLPRAFELSFDSFHNIRKCSVVWRQGDCAGVAFAN